MLRAVLKRLTTDELLKCRQVNSEWNELSTQILHHRTDTVLRFRFENEHYMRNIRFQHCDMMGSDCPDWYRCTTESMTDLLNCFKDCKRCPYTAFDFGDLAHFENEEMKRLLSIWGRQIHCLTIKMPDPVECADLLKKLLLEQVPNLKKLEIEFNDDHRFTSSGETSTPMSQTFPLFQKFQLPKLEILVVCTRYRKFRGIVESLLTAACNLKIFKHNTSHLERNNIRDRAVLDSITTQDLIMLQSLDKLQCLQAIEICLSEDLITYWKQYLMNLDLKLQTIHLSFAEIWENQLLRVDATLVVNQLLESSQVVIETLAMEPMGLLPGVVFPKLDKLHTLDLRPVPNTGMGSECTMFPQPFEMADVFPNLKELDIYDVCTNNYFPQPLTPMPSIEILRMYGNPPPENKEKFLKMTPNVKTFLLAEDTPYQDVRDNFIKGFQVIVNNLTKLETFGWVFLKLTHQDLLYKLDAAITGFPEDFCEKMSLKFRTENMLSANDRASIEPQRKHSTILDLKELKRLDVTFIFDMDSYGFAREYGMCDSDFEDPDCERDCESTSARRIDEAGYGPESIFYETGFTKVSEFLAFRLKPTLKIRTHRRLDQDFV